jgi:hypothetical protein
MSGRDTSTASRYDRARVPRPFALEDDDETSCMACRDSIGRDFRGSALGLGSEAADASAVRWKHQERTRERVRKLLRAHFTDVTIADRTDFDPAMAKGADVVIFDWSQSDSNLESTKVPFGRFEEWTKPTVQVNHAGLLVAERWHVIGRFG